MAIHELSTSIILKRPEPIPVMCPFRSVSPVVYSLHPNPTKPAIFFPLVKRVRSSPSSSTSLIAVDRFEPCLQCALEADRFFRSQFQNPCGDALFWQAAALLRLGRTAEAQLRARELGECLPHYPHLARLRQLIP